MTDLSNELARYMADEIGHGMTEKTQRFADLAISFIERRTSQPVAYLKAGSLRSPGAFPLEWREEPEKHGLTPLFASPPSQGEPVAVKGLEVNPFGAVRFAALKATGEHAPSYVLADQGGGTGPLIEINHHADHHVDNERAEWTAAALNAAIYADRANRIDAKAEPIWGSTSGLTNEEIQTWIDDLVSVPCQMALRELIASRSGVEVDVNALAWCETDGDGFVREEAECILGLYRISHSRITGKWRWSLNALDGPWSLELPTHEAAKAAAQADYEQRIRSALSPAPSLAVSGKADCCVPDEGEPSFVLLGRDPQASALIEEWARVRSIMEPHSPKIDMAREIAAKMSIYKIDNPEKGARADAYLRATASLAVPAMNSVVERLRPKHMADEPLARAVTSGDQRERRAAVSAYLVANNGLKSEAIAEIERLTKERDDAFAANERDRSIIADARASFNAALARRSWLLEGRGSYEWDDDRWKDEFGEAIKELRAPLDVLGKLGIDWSLCPTSPEEIAAARIDWKARAETTTRLLTEVTGALEGNLPPPDWYSDGFQIKSKPFNHNGLEAAPLYTPQTIRSFLSNIRGQQTEAGGPKPS